MKVIRETIFLSLLLIGILFLGSASATIFHDLLYLPESSYANEVDNWQGWSVHEEGNFNVRIDFAVYDTSYLGFGPSGQDEEDFVNSLIANVGLTGQYIYVYQIFQHNPEEGVFLSKT